MNKYLILILLVLPFVSALNTTETFDVFNNSCYEYSRIKIVQQVPTNYTLSECNGTNFSDIYMCDCDYNITFKQNEDVPNVYNFIIEYYIGNNTENDKRQISINNIWLGEEEKKEQFKMPEFKNMNSIFWFLGIFFIIIGVIIFFVVRALFKNEDNQIWKIIK